MSYGKGISRNRGDKNGMWHGGRSRMTNGYIIINVQPDDFFYRMTFQTTSLNHYIYEHRLVMAKHLGRCLLSWEIVHHKNGIKDDNRFENLELLPAAKQHLSSIRWQTELNKRDKRIVDLEKRVTLLEAENIFLKTETSEEVYRGLQ